MVNYGNSKIYKIWSPNGDNIYIGSTTKKYLSQRMVEHRCDYNKHLTCGKQNVSSSILNI